MNRRFFDKARLLFFQFSDFVFVSGNHGGVAGAHYPGQQSVDFFFNTRDLAFGGGRDFSGLSALMVPSIFEHRCGQGKELLAGLELLDQVPDIRFHLITGNGLAVAAAGLCLTKVIRVAFRFALGPGRAQGCVTIGATDKTAQGKVIADILAHRGLGNAIAACLYLLIGFNGDQWLVVAFEPV